VLLVADLLAWTTTLGLSAHRNAEPKRLRLRPHRITGCGASSMCDASSDPVLTAVAARPEAPR
jgi:hypothetical protein